LEKSSLIGMIEQTDEGSNSEEPRALSLAKGSEKRNPKLV